MYLITFLKVVCGTIFLYYLTRRTVCVVVCVGERCTS